MLRNKLKEYTTETEPDFLYRGKESTRIEALSDAVFGFAITLLVVSLEVPSSFNALLKSFEGFIGFVLCIILLFGLWYEHYIFFLRYGLKDSKTIFLNGLLLFMMLFYIYPLKFLFSFFGKLFFMIMQLFKGEDVSIIKHQIFVEMIAPEQIPLLMILYGLGASGVFFLFALLYKNALNKKEALALNAVEIAYTRLSIIKNILMGAVPLASALLAAMFYKSSIGLSSMLSGAAYGLYGCMAVFHAYEKKVKAKAHTLMPQNETV
jgi:uncharacterized membrane protein